MHVFDVVIQGRVKFDSFGTIVIQRIRILQYRKSTG